MELKDSFENDRDLIYLCIDRSIYLPTTYLPIDLICLHLQ